MTDIKSIPNPRFLQEEALREAIELLFFAYRDFTGEPDRVLDSMGMGRAHHRAIYFVGLTPGITVSELLAILRITKQALARVLRHLIDEGFLHQTEGADDRRKRHLFLTEKGQQFERELSETQFRLLADAFAQAGPEDVDGFKTILKLIIAPQDRERYLS